MDEVMQEAPRLRLASDIDLNKANPLCIKCRGTGHSGKKEISNPERPSEKVNIPIICRCVTQGGGVAEDAMDRILKETEQQLESGLFASQLASDIKLLPPEAKAKAIDSLNEQMKDKTKDKRLLAALKEALEQLEREGQA